MNENELTPYERRYNFWALILCVVKRNHPNINYNDDPSIFEENGNYEEYKKIAKDFFSPDETINALEIIQKIF